MAREIAWRLVRQLCRPAPRTPAAKSSLLSRGHQCTPTTARVPALPIAQSIGARRASGASGPQVRLSAARLLRVVDVTCMSGDARHVSVSVARVGSLVRSIRSRLRLQLIPLLVPVILLIAAELVFLQLLDGLLRGLVSNGGNGAYSVGDLGPWSPTSASGTQLPKCYVRGERAQCDTSHRSRWPLTCWFAHFRLHSVVHPLALARTLAATSTPRWLARTSATHNRPRCDGCSACSLGAICSRTPCVRSWCSALTTAT